jgi:hypothetical protein
MIMDLLALYKTILESVDLHVNKDDMVYYQNGGDKDPILVKGKRLVLPTRAILREGLGEKMVAFHPISENWLTEGETAVFTEFRKYASLSLTLKSLLLLTRLAGIASDSKTHGSLTPKQHEFLSHVPNLDAKAYLTIGKVFENVDIEGNNRLLNIYVRKTGKLAGKSFNRVGFVRFPILDQLEEGKDTVFGVKQTGKKQLPMLRALIEYVFPDAEGDPGYSCGSNDDMAPGLDALLRSFLNVAKRINQVVKLFRNVLEDGDTIKRWESLTVDVSWEDSIADLSAYRGQIPNLDAAEKVGVVEQPQTAIVATTGPVVDTSALNGGQQTGGFNFDLYSKHQAATLAAPTIANPPIQTGYDIPKIESNDGVDFNALRAKNAQVAGMGGYPVMQPQQVFLQQPQAPVQPPTQPIILQTAQGPIQAVINPQTGQYHDVRTGYPIMMPNGAPMMAQPAGPMVNAAGIPIGPGPGMMQPQPTNPRMSTLEQQQFMRQYYGGMMPQQPMQPMMMGGGNPAWMGQPDPRMMGGYQGPMGPMGGFPGGVMVDNMGRAFQPGYNGPMAVNVTGQNPYPGLSMRV